MMAGFTGFKTPYVLWFVLVFAFTTKNDPKKDAYKSVGQEQGNAYAITYVYKSKYIQ